MRFLDAFSAARSGAKATSALKRKFFGAHFRDYTGLGRSEEDAALFFLLAAIFVHWTLSIVVVLAVAAWILFSKKRLTSALRPRFGAFYILALLYLFAFVSLCKGNYLSAGAFVGISLYALVSLWVRSFMTRRRYERMLDLSIAMGFFGVFLGVVQKFILHVDEWDSYLVKGPTNNANYFGMMLLMLIITALFRLFQTGFKKHVFFYLSSVLSNFIMLLFTESVASYFGLILGLLLLLLVFRYYKCFAALLALLSSVFTLGFFVSGSPWNGSLLYPILERAEIWKIAWRSIRENAANLLTGQGLFSFQGIWDEAPHTFWDVRGVIPRDFQPHSHNLYLEMLLSVGVIGLLLLLIYGLWEARVLLCRARIPQLRAHCVFFVVLFVSALFSNLADATLFWMQTGLWLLFCSSCTGIPLSSYSDSATKPEEKSGT